MVKPYSPWTDDPKLVGRLRRLWRDGLSIAEIARRLGVSKNAVASKRLRLGLPERGDPIKRGMPEAEKKKHQRRKGGAAALVPLASLAPKPVPEPRPQSPYAARAVVAMPPPTKPVIYGRVVTCCWPIGHPREKAFHFCDAASEPGRVYCTEHARIAYQPHTRRDAA